MVGYLRRNMSVILVAAALIPLVVAAVVLKMASYGPDSSGTHRVTQVIGGPFTLLSTSGQSVTPETWPGKFLVIVFGYRFCPDVCPTSLGTIGNALDRLGPDGYRFQPLFVTVDPERDTIDKLRDYVALFHPRLIGLTGTPAEITTIARNFKIFYRKVEGATPDTYTVDHTAFFFVTDDHGVVIKVFNRDIAPEQLAEAFKALLVHL